MDNNWHVVKEDDRYVVLDNSSLSKLVPSITKLNPNNIVLIERNEFALYDLARKLNAISNSFKIHPILGCVTDDKFLENVIRKYDVEIIFHAAAYLIH
mgnify:CR=1 FL=1